MIEDRDVLILVVDDEDAIRNVLAAIFRKAFPRARLLFAPTGEDALALLRFPVVDLIVTDFRMPGLSGLEFLSRAARLQPSAARLMLSGHSEDEIFPDGKGREIVDAFLRKPATTSDLVKTVVRIVEERDTRRRSDLDRVRSA